MPPVEYWFHRFCDLVQTGEVPLMSGHSTNKLPYALNRIGFGTVGWKEIEGKPAVALVPPFPMKIGMMVSGIVANKLDPPSRMATDRAKIPQEEEKGLRIESLGPMEQELSILKAYSAKVSDALSRRMVVDDRVLLLGRNPHVAP